MNIAARTPQPGDNVRPALVDASQLAKDFDHLERVVGDLASRGNAFPLAIEDDDDLGIANKLVADCRTETDKIDRAREAEKRPYLDAGRIVDAYFKTLTTRLDRMKAAIGERATRYLNKKADAERAVRAAEARKLQEEADRRAHEAILAEAKAPAGAPTPETTTAMTQATQAQMRADDKAAEAQATRADLARTRTEGSTATLVDDWQAEITAFDQIDLNKLRPYFSRPDVEKAIRRHVGIHKDAEPLAGVRIFNKPKARMV
jgi:hypothetical protein